MKDYFEEYHRGTPQEHAETLRRTLEGHAVRLMGPNSPFWYCSYCGNAQTTPVHFEHKATCLLAPLSEVEEQPSQKETRRQLEDDRSWGSQRE